MNDRFSQRWQAKLKRGISTAIIFVISTSMAYGLGEIIVRIWFPQAMLPRYVTDTPYGVRMNMPNMSFWHTSPDYHVNIRTNSHGIRSDKEIPYTKAPGTVRILGLGDSFALGYEVDLEDTYLYQLEKKLQAKGARNVEVINLGVSGFGTAEELITLLNEGFKYSPDIVILGYCTNDIENNVTSDLYALQGDSLRRKSMIYLPAIGMRQFLYSIPGYKYLAENSQLLNIFRNRISFFIQQRLYDRTKEDAAKSLATEGESGTLRKDSTVELYEKKLTARLLDGMYLECAKRNISFVILNIPLALSSWKDIYSNLPLGLMKNADKVVLVDAKDLLKPYHHKRQMHWERWQVHWLPWVHHLVAEALADTLMRHWDFHDFQASIALHSSPGDSANNPSCAKAGILDRKVPHAHAENVRLLKRKPSNHH